MLGQLSFEALTEQETKLRNQIKLEIIPNSVGNQIVKQYHYLHRVRRRGRQLTYGIMYKGELVGVIVYASSTLCRKKGLTPPLEPGEIVELARLWLAEKAPKHSETCAIGKSIRMVETDWHRKYGVRPGVIISFSDLEFGHKGTIYKAASFEDWGFAPRARLANVGGRIKDAPETSKTKRLWVYWLK